eukprot:3217922-Pyramimonas_sp.AAC.1
MVQKNAAGSIACRLFLDLEERISKGAHDCSDRLVGPMRPQPDLADEFPAAERPLQICMGVRVRWARGLLLENDV